MPQRSSATYPARCSSVIVADMRGLLSSLSSVVALRLTEWLDMEVRVGTLPLTRVHQPPAGCERHTKPFVSLLRQNLIPSGRMIVGCLDRNVREARRATRVHGLSGSVNS